MINEGYWKNIAQGRLAAYVKLEEEVIALLEQLDPLELENLLDPLPSITEIWDRAKEDE